MIAYIPRDNYATNGFCELAKFGNHIGNAFLSRLARGELGRVEAAPTILLSKWERLSAAMSKYGLFSCN
jgi:hypothetical protein